MEKQIGRMFPGMRIVEEISYGWSGERKFRLCDAKGTEYLLRTAGGEQYEKMRAIHEAMQAVNALPVRASRAVDCGLSAGDDMAWALLTYVQGEDAESALKALSQADQYRLGCESGWMLRMIHSLPAPQNRPGWAEYFGAKIDRKRARWRASGITAQGAQETFAFIDARRHLLQGRPQSLQHGDYHCGNMVYTPDGHIAAIDFNRLDWGDPWEEFNRIIWDVRASHAFARGRIDGYFDGQKPPELFWELLALYVANDQVSALPWAVAFGAGEERISRENFAAVLEWYDGFRRIVPTWYKS